MSGQGAKDAKVKELEERLFTAVWENLQNVGELGSLVQVREGVSRVLSDWVEAALVRRGSRRLIHRLPAQQQHLSSSTRSIANGPLQLELERHVLEDEARHLETELLTALEEPLPQRPTTRPTDCLLKTLREA